jgi:hypothetical protein
VKFPLINYPLAETDARIGLSRMVPSDDFTCF